NTSNRESGRGAGLAGGLPAWASTGHGPPARGRRPVAAAKNWGH
nr:hypothetical protein [Tanacetum cinerariifolium]